MNRPEKYKTNVEDDHLVMSGYISDGKGLQYMARLTAINKNGIVSDLKEHIKKQKPINIDRLCKFLKVK